MSALPVEFDVSALAAQGELDFDLSAALAERLTLDWRASFTLAPQWSFGFTWKF